MKRCDITCSICSSIAGIVLSILTTALPAADIGFLVDPDEVVDGSFDQFWVARLEDQGHNVSVLPANYAADNPGAVSADIFIGSNDIGSGDFISTSAVVRQFNLNPIDLAGNNDVEVSMLFAAGSAGFDVDVDFIRVNADADGDGEYETLLTEFLPTPDGELQQVDGDEVILEPIFQEVTISVPNDITTLRLQVNPFTTAGPEQFGFDNIRVTANGSTLGTETFEGGAGQVGFTSVGQAVGGGNQFFDLSTAEGVAPDIAFEDFEGDVWFGGADVDATFGFLATFRLNDSRPLITYEDALFDELQMAADPATGRSDGESIIIVDTDHPLAAGLTGDDGEVFIYDAAQGITFLGAPEDLSENVDVVAVNLDGQAVIAVLEKGQLGLSGDPAPGQRIGIFAHDTGDGSLYSDEALALLDAAVAHAIASIDTNVLGDCNDDGSLGPADLGCVSTIEERDAVVAAIPSVLGDLDGNGNVAFADFLILSANFGQANPSYAKGNIDLEGNVSFADFLTLSGNFGQSAGAAAVPEPDGWLLLVGGFVVPLVRRRHHKA